MSEIDASTLLPNERLREMAANGEMDQLHRGDAYAEAGDTFELDGRTFEVTDVTRETLGDISDEDARREGADDLEAYRRRLEHAHENLEWDDDSEAVRHRFGPVEE